MKKLLNYTTLFLLVVLGLSCSSDDEAQTASMVFNSLNADKTKAFTDDKIILTLDGSGYSSSEIASSNPDIKVTKVTSTTYEVTSANATSATIYATLRSNTESKSKNLAVSFFRHGYIAPNTFEGIKVNSDTQGNVLELLGEPTTKETSTDGKYELLRYLSKGIFIRVLKSSGVVDDIWVFSNSYGYAPKDGVWKAYTKYPFDLINGWKVGETKMDAVVEKLGTPQFKKLNTANNEAYYDYTTSRTVYYFNNAQTEDDYKDRTFNVFVIY